MSNLFILRRNLKSEMIRYYRKSMGPALRPFVESAMRTYAEMIPECKWLEGPTFSHVQRIASALAAVNPRSKELSKSDFTPEGFIRSSEKFKRIEPGLISLRHEVFKQKTPPFQSVDDALAYFHKPVRGEGKGMRVDIELHGQYFLVLDDSPLGRLAHETKRLAEDSPFSQSALVGFIMTGIKPVGMKYSIKTTRGFPRPNPKDRSVPTRGDSFDSFPLHHVDIRLYRTLTDREILALIKEINRITKPTRKRLSAKALRVYEFIGEYGTPPETGKMKYWEGAFREWRRHNPKDKIRSSAGIRMAWTRLYRSL